MNTRTRYNPNRKGKAFNEEPQQTLTEVTEEQRREADERLRELIEKARQKVEE